MITDNILTLETRVVASIRLFGLVYIYIFTKFLQISDLPWRDVVLCA